MPITINSPYSGRPVKVRDQDLNRAVRDEEGRVFYVVARADGSGHYAAPTRKGSAKDEQRYDEMAAKMQRSQEQVAVQHEAAFDATGKGRGGGVGRKLVLLVLLLVLAAAGYGAYTAFLAGPPATTPGNAIEDVLPVPDALPSPEPLDRPLP
ncbi:MAG: hypothetical protein AAF710_11185 [Planctomycetota bacterium]